MEPECLKRQSWEIIKEKLDSFIVFELNLNEKLCQSTAPLAQQETDLEFPSGFFFELWKQLFPKRILFYF